MSNKPSKYQEQVYLKTITTNKDLIIGATAGSGKTTTIVEAAKLIPYGKKGVFLAFNRDIVEELGKRLPPTIERFTLHGLGRRSLGVHYQGQIGLNEKKQIRYIEPLFEELDRTGKIREKWAQIYVIDKIMSLVRATMTNSTSYDEIEAMCEYYAMEDVGEGHIRNAMRALKKFNSYNDDPDRYDLSIDYQDMVELPVRNRKIRMPQYDYVFVDECQDMSALDQMFLDKLVKPVTGRMIVVGDPNQSIYGFRGAAPNSFEKFTKRPNSIFLPLSISYRCAKAIVREAKTIYPEIEEWDESEEGSVRKGGVDEIQEGDMVLCRNVKPLIVVFLKLIEQDKKAYIRGKDNEKGLLNLLIGIGSEFEEHFDNLLAHMRSELMAKGVRNYANHPKYGQLSEKIEILRLLFSKFGNLEDVERFIESVFQDEDRDGVALMTIHKSKGLECNRVFIVDTFGGKSLIPSEYAITPDQLKQEKNLSFVAVTRAKKELIRINL